MQVKTSLILVLKILALTVILTMVNGLAVKLLPAAGSADAASEAAAAPVPPPGSFFAVVLLMMFVLTVALSYPVIRSRWHGWRLTAAVFLLYFGTVTFMSQIESLVYLGSKMPEGMLEGLFAMGAVAALLFSPVVVLVLGKWGDDTTLGENSPRYAPRTTGEWTWKIAVGGFVYLALYYLFGYFVAWQVPEIRDYYGGTDPGSFIAQMTGILQNQPWMIIFQFVRGLLWVGLGVLVIRVMKGTWIEVGLASALLFSAPTLGLLLPNEMMPEPVRMGHFVETLPYQFFFGWFVAWLFCRFGTDKLEPDAV